VLSKPGRGSPGGGGGPGSDVPRPGKMEINGRESGRPGASSGGREGSHCNPRSEARRWRGEPDPAGVTPR
jgi:hypothetical protein